MGGPRTQTPTPLNMQGWIELKDYSKVGAEHEVAAVQRRNLKTDTTKILAAQQEMCAILDDINKRTAGNITDTNESTSLTIAAVPAVQTKFKEWLNEVATNRQCILTPSESNAEELEELSDQFMRSLANGLGHGLGKAIAEHMLKGIDRAGKHDLYVELSKAAFSVAEEVSVDSSTETRNPKRKRVTYTHKKHKTTAEAGRGSPKIDRGRNEFVISDDSDDVVVSLITPNSSLRAPRKAAAAARVKTQHIARAQKEFAKEEKDRLGGSGRSAKYVVRDQPTEDEG